MVGLARSQGTGPNQKVGVPQDGIQIPGLGKNPWAIDGFLGGKRSLEDLLKGMDGAKGDQLRKWAEEQKAKMSPDQKEMLARMLRDMESNKWDKNTPWKDLVKQLYPQGSEEARSQLQSILKGETPEPVPNLPTPPEKDSQAGQLNPPEANPIGPRGGQPPTPPERETPPMPPQRGGGNEVPTPTPPTPPGGTPGGARPAPTGSEPLSATQPGADRIDQTLKTLFPMGLDRWARPFGRDLLKNTANWTKDWKLPKDWGEGLRKSLAGLQLPPGTSLPTGPSLPQMAGGVGSVSRPLLPLFIMVAGLALAFLVWFFWQRLGFLGQGLGVLHSRERGPGRGLVDALELAVLRAAGDEQAVANHVQWQSECAQAFSQKGLSPREVEDLFDQYVRVKYRGETLDPEREHRSVAALNRV